MKIYPNTTIYKNVTEMVSTIQKIIANKEPSNIFLQMDNIAIEAANEVAVALHNVNIAKVDKHLLEVEHLFIKLDQLANLASQQKLLTEKETQQLSLSINSVWNSISDYPKNRKNILILSSRMGQGHMSACNALKQGLEYLYGRDHNVVIIDFYEKVAPILNAAIIKSYENSTKHVPNAYKYFYDGTDYKWPTQLWNIISYPLNASKVESIFHTYNPDIIISAYPIWDLLTFMVLQKLGNIKFLSLVTDSITIHNCWTVGKHDYHFVPNIETAISLKKLGIPENKIKALGFPVKLAFSQSSNRKAFLSDNKLDPENYTILYLPTTQSVTKSKNNIEEIIKNFPDANLTVVCGRDEDLLPELIKYDKNKNVRIIGWTDQMPEYIKNSDLIITKAGGAIVMECLAAEKPMIITSVIPGQEIGNAELIKLYDIGIIQNEANMSISESIEYMRKNENRIKKNIKKISTPDAAIKIAQFIHKQLN